MRLGKSLLALSRIALSGALLTGLPVSPATAAPGSSEYAQWTLAGDTGTVKVANVGGEGDFTTTGANAELAAGSNTWLSDTTPFGLVFGSSRGTKYLSTGLAAGSSTATVTYTFTSPGRVGTWGFALGDVDAESIAIRATGPDGRSLDVNYWFQGGFNYCATPGTTPSTCTKSVGVDIPRWDPATATLTGGGIDTKGASAWFRPTESVRTLTLEMTGLRGSPRYQTWMAADDDETPPEYQVTVAARKCPTYQDVMANKARNNVMQSLEDLGVDSIYPGGVPVQPSVETDPATGQSACTPMEGWTFAFGNGFGAPDTGAFGSLTPIVNLNGTATTKASTPLLDSLGNPTGQTLAGATTIPLNATQIALIEGAGSLTAQGGVPGYPLNGSTNVAFGVVRCATDNVNGDNVEYVNFPAGSRHVFCYAYYVDEAPAPGKITITKQVTGPSDGVDFNFSGNVSYNPRGAFTLKHAQSISFERQAGLTWTVIEEDSTPYTLEDITCTGGANVTIDVAQRKADILLGPGEDVRCTFNNALVPGSSLSVYKVSENGVGTFGGDITGPNGYAETWTATTTEVDKPVQGFDDAGLPAGTYRVSETPPTDWATGVACGYADDSTIISAAGTSIDVPIATGQEALCLFLNRLDLDGSITVTSKVIGGTGAVTANSQYRVSPISGFSVDIVALSNTAWNTIDSGSTRAPLTLGTYRVKGNPPADTTANTWSVDSVTCTGGGIVSGTDATVTLNGTNPDVTCDYVYRAEPLNPTLTLTKTVTAGNDLRTGPVLIDVLCTTASGPFTSTVALPVGSSTISTVLTLPTDTTSCKAVESTTGAPTAIDPGTISVTADGADWPAGQVQSVPNGTTLAVTSTSSSGVPVTESITGPCVASSAGVTPTSATGTCILTFRASGGEVLTTTSWTANGAAGSGNETSTFSITPGGAHSVTFDNSYAGTETETTTTRTIQAEANPGTLIVTKTVPQGNDLRNGPVTIRILCAVSAVNNPSAWPKTLTLDVAGATASRNISVPGNAQNNDVCIITETSTGFVDPGAGSIKPTWNGKAWKSTATKSLLIGDSATVKATATTGAAVTSSASTPCTLTGTQLTASREGTCTIGFTAGGTPKVTVDTSYPLGRSVITTAGQTSRLDVVDRYTSTPRTLTAKRTVTVMDTPPCPLDVSAARSVSANGTTLLIKSVTTGDGCGITDIEVTCPTARATPRGDYGCTVRRDPDGRVYVTTYGNKNLTVTAKVVAEGPDHTKTTWTRTWSVS